MSLAFVRNTRPARALRLCALGALIAAGAAHAGAEAPGDFSRQLPLVTGSDALQRLTLPAAAYEGMQRGNLNDLRVFNGKGEAVPIARVDLPPEPPAPKTFSPRLFALPAVAQPGEADTAVTIKRDSQGSVVSVVTGARGNAAPAVVAWVADANSWNQPISALVVEAEAQAAPLDARLLVEGSDDLAGWRTLAAHAPIIRLARDGQVLERNRITLGGARARYLRLRWTDGTQTALKNLTIESAEARPEPAREWRTLPLKQQADDGYEFVANGLYPVDRLRVRLPQRNTVAPVSIYSRERPSEPWRLRASTVVYRLQVREQEQNSADIALPPLREPLWRLVFDAKGGGIGGGAPELELGWVPEEIVFAARGEPPFTLAVGKLTAASALYPIATLVNDPTPARIAALGQARAEPNAAGGPPVARDQSGGGQRWVLWAALGAGVLVLAAMARSLLRGGKPG